jgi:hypothetical protein
MHYTPAENQWREDPLLLFVHQFALCISCVSPKKTVVQFTFVWTHTHHTQPVTSITADEFIPAISFATNFKVHNHASSTVFCTCYLPVISLLWLSNFVNPGSVLKNFTCAAIKLVLFLLLKTHITLPCLIVSFDVIYVFFWIQSGLSFFCQQLYYAVDSTCVRPHRPSTVRKDRSCLTEW